MHSNANLQDHAHIVVRDIGRQAEMREVEQLQKEVWGLPDLDVVPLTQLVAARASGGILIGAFDGGKLVGFTYGFVGLEDGRPTHHSHMLAVSPRYRNLNLGYKLKQAQRDVVLAQGIVDMTWTFDPLQSLNAYFNFHRLGVLSGRYFVDFYGSEAASFLHRNGTDRLWVTWPLASRRVEERLSGMPAEIVPDDATPLIELGENGNPLDRAMSIVSSAEVTYIEIPARIDLIESESPELAAEWRAATRAAFTQAFASGYLVCDFIRGEKAGKYILYRKPPGN